MEKLNKKEYADIVKNASPPSPILKDTVFAFLSGGAICAFGEFLRRSYMALGADKESAACWVSISLIFIAALLTAFNVFDKLAKFCGAGTLVPITGFSNSVVSTAMEFKTEGFVTGTGAKVFTVAGPVIFYGGVSSVIAGLIYWFIR